MSQRVFIDFYYCVSRGGLRLRHKLTRHFWRVNLRRCRRDGACAAHGQYADEQLQNMQKRICLIEFLRLCFVIVYQGGKANKKSRELKSSRPKIWAA